MVSANRLPKPIRGAAVVPYDNSFLLVGGFSDGLYSADIHMYNAVDDEWIKLEAINSLYHIHGLAGCCYADRVLWS